MSIGILGGGLSGVTLQRMLEPESEILEKEDALGGLCRTFWHGDFGYDIGGHILYTRNQTVSDLLTEVLGDNVNRGVRANQVFFKGRYVRYPFENDLAALDLQDRYECLIDYLKANYPPPTNLSEWAYSVFGKGIAEKYLVPYNRKIWKLDPALISLGWVSRIPRPPLEDVVKSALGIATEGYTHQLHFRYPREGGIAALVKSMARPGAARTTGFEVSAIESTSSGWRVSGTRGTRDFERLVLTYPIHQAVNCLAGVPDQVKQALCGLRYNLMYVVMIAVGNQSLMDKSAIYIPDPEVLPHRVCYMGYFSPSMVRKGSSSLIAEVTMPGNDPRTPRIGRAEALERTISDLARIGIVRQADIVASEIREIEYAYPVYTLDYDANLAVVRDYFVSLGIELLGRFAEFNYINMDEVIRRAMVMADRLNAVCSGQRSAVSFRRSEAEC